MSDGQLTQAEHDAMRRRVLAGAKRIHPVGRHRNAVIAGAVAVVLVLGLAGGALGLGRLLGAGEPIPAVTPTPSVSMTPTPTPTPTATAQTPRVAFNGDCTKVLTDQEASAALGASVSLQHSSAGTLFDSERPVTALMGGVGCNWENSDSHRFVSAYVLDARVLPAAEKLRYDQVVCSGLDGSICETGRLVGDTWLGARIDLLGGDPSDVQRRQVATRLSALLDILQSRVYAGIAVAVPRAASWWSLPSCEALTSTVADASARDIVSGPLTDNVPDGMMFDIAEAADYSRWCPWRTNSDEVWERIELTMEPGVGGPPDEAVDASGAQPFEVPGADRAWIDADTRSPDDKTVVAIAGPNRLIVQMHAPDDGTIRSVAAAVLAKLG